MPPHLKKKAARERKRKGNGKGKGATTSHPAAATNSHGNGEGNLISHDEDSGTRELSSSALGEPSVTGDKRNSSRSVGDDNPMEATEENGGLGKSNEVDLPLSGRAPEDVKVEFVRDIEGVKGGSSGSSSEDELQSAPIATLEGELLEFRRLDLVESLQPSLVANPSVQPSDLVESSSEQPSAVVAESLAVASVSVPDLLGRATGDLKISEDVVASVVKSDGASVFPSKSAVVLTPEIVLAVEGADSEKSRDDADWSNDTTNRESADNQQIGLTPLPVRTTSWKSCCGLFELLGNFNR